MMVRQPRAQLGRLKRIGGLRFLYNRQIYRCSKFYDDEIEEPPQEFVDNLPSVLETLKERERLVLTLRYLDGEPRSLAQVGQVMGVTKERVRQIESRALHKLMHPTRKRTLGIEIEKKSRYHAKEGAMGGLTFIEVLIIVAILGILAAVVAPNLFRLLGW